MGKLVDDAALINALNLAEWFNIADFNEAVYTVRKAQPVDAVPVVRCKECKMFYMKKDIFGEVPWCKAWHRGTIETMFCGWGKRKDGERHEQSKRNNQYD